MADFRLIGEAFDKAANVAASGLMERYQRERDIEDWKKKQDYSAGIQEQEEKRRQAFQMSQRDREEFLKTKREQFKHVPEMMDIFMAADKGDPAATEVYAAYLGAERLLDQKVPLTPDDINATAKLPPYIRSKIFARHLDVMNAEIKRKADLERVGAATEASKAAAKRSAYLVDRDKKKVTEDEDKEVSAIRKETAKIRTERIASRADKEKALDTIVEDIDKLKDSIFEKRRARAKADNEEEARELERHINDLQTRIARLDVNRGTLEADLQREYDLDKAYRPDIVPPDIEAEPMFDDTLPEDLQKVAFGYTDEAGKEVPGMLNEEDLNEIARTALSRPELDYASIVQLRVAFKMREKELSSMQTKSRTYRR